MIPDSHDLTAFVTHMAHTFSNLTGFVTKPLSYWMCVGHMSHDTFVSWFLPRCFECWAV